METSFSILIWMNKSKINSKNKAPIYGRITINGKRSEIALKIFIEPDRWDNAKGYVKGNKEDARLINNTIDNFIIKARKIYESLSIKEGNITSESIKNILTGKSNERRFLIEIFENYIKEMTELVNIDYAIGTIKNYNITNTHLKRFIKHAYMLNDIALSELDFGFITKFEYYLKVHKKLGQNSVHKQMQLLRKMIRIAINNAWLEKDPFVKYSIKKVHTEREMLTHEELHRIEQKSFSIERLEHVKDIFIFSCYTGIAYIDIYNLTKDNILNGIDSEKWIKINRQKTGTPSSVPLLPKALEIINKYKNCKFQSNRPPNSNLN